MARGNFRTDDRVCLYCGYRNPDNTPMPYKIGKGANKTYLCEKCHFRCCVKCNIILADTCGDMSSNNLRIAQIEAGFTTQDGVLYQRDKQIYIFNVGSIGKDIELIYNKLYNLLNQGCNIEGNLHIWNTIYVQNSLFDVNTIEGRTTVNFINHLLNQLKQVSNVRLPEIVFYTISDTIIPYRFKELFLYEIKKTLIPQDLIRLITV